MCQSQAPTARRMRTPKKNAIRNVESRNIARPLVSSGSSRLILLVWAPWKEIRASLADLRRQICDASHICGLGSCEP